MISILSVPGATDRSHIYIQATIPIPHPDEVLLAEAQGAILATRIAAFLKMENVTYMTDNATIMQTISKYKNNRTIGSRKLRPMLAHFSNCHHRDDYCIIKINRSTNRSAHLLAKQARHADHQSPCPFSCQARNHSSQCSNLIQLYNFPWGPFLPKSVICIWSALNIIYTFKKKLKKTEDPE